MKKYDTKQVYYGDWGDELLPEHKNYWADIEDIAGLISLDLESFRSSMHMDVEYFKFSSISVIQHKEKFGGVRVYCTMFDERYCEKEYEHRKATYKDFNKTKKEFVIEQTIENFRHYRHVYMKFARLFPHYELAIIGSADYPEILLKTKEEFDEFALKNPGWADPDMVYAVCGWKR